MCLMHITKVMKFQKKNVYYAYVRIFNNTKDAIDQHKLMRRKAV